MNTKQRNIIGSIVTFVLSIILGGTEVTITSSNINSYLNWYLHLSTQEECAEALSSGYVDGSNPVLSEFDYTYGTLVASFGNQTYLDESQQRRLVNNG